MNALTFTPNQRMSTREIAALTGKRHDNVLRTIRQLDSEGVTQSEETHYLDPQNKQSYPEHMMAKRDSLVLVARLSPEFTGRVVDRWLELEAGQVLKVPQTMAQALRLAAEQAEQIEQQQAALALAAPKVEFVDRYVESSSGAKGFRQVCKMLAAKEPEFRKFLEDRKIMYRLNGEWTAYAYHLDAGRFEVKTGTAPESEHAYTTTKFTAKGITWISKLWAERHAGVAA